MYIALLFLLIGANFLLVHGPAGQEYYIAIEQITTLRSPTKVDLGNSFTEGVHCIIVTTSGKFVPVIESCSDIYKAIMK
jgi:hypothetical protein